MDNESKANYLPEVFQTFAEFFWTKSLKEWEREKEFYAKVLLYANKYLFEMFFGPATYFHGIFATPALMNIGVGTHLYCISVGIFQYILL